MVKAEKKSKKDNKKIKLKNNPKKIEEEIVRLMEESQEKNQKKIREILRENKKEASKEGREKNIEDKLKKESRPKRHKGRISNELYSQVSRITPNYSGNSGIYDFSGSSLDYDAIYRHMGQEKKDPYKTYLESLSYSFLESVSQKDLISEEQKERIMKKRIIEDILGSMKEFESQEEKERYDNWMMLNKFEWWWKLQVYNNLGYKNIV